MCSQRSPWKQQLHEDGGDSATVQTADTTAGLEHRYKGLPVVQGLRLHAPNAGGPGSILERELNPTCHN